MKRMAAVCLMLAGCSSAPVADVMDLVHPGRLPPAPGYHGGAGAQSQTTPPASAGAPQPSVPVDESLSPADVRPPR